MALAALLLFSFAQQDAPSLSSRVNRAIARGVEHIKKAQRPDGSYPGAENEHPGGMSALCAFTLAKSGVRRSDPAIQSALKSVLATEFKSVYSHSVRLMLFDSLGQPDTWRTHATASLDFIVENQRNGEWAYPWGEPDASNTQFALLGLRAAHRLGLEIPDATLASAVRPMFTLQETHGGFRYRGDSRPTGGITAATLGGLCVVRELGAGRGAVEKELRKYDKSRELGTDWLVAHWDPAHNASGERAWTPTFQYPFLWAIERYGGLSNQKSLGERDWYTDGAEWLVEQQLDDGGWGFLENTCFALLFLRRATVTSGDALGESDAALDAPKKSPPIEPAPGLARLTDWLVAGPWHSKETNTILLDPPFDPKKVAAKLGDKLARSEWRRVTLKSDGWTNLDELTANEGDCGMYAAALTIAWNMDAPLEATLWLDLEDGWDVYFDGARLSNSNRVAAPIDGRVAVQLTLTRGEHRLLCLIEDDRGSAAFGARLSDRAGKPLAQSPECHAVPPRGSKR